MNKTLPILLGPTASGKTRLAALAASVLQSEIIGADSRHVYKGMDLGTGKDYDDYIVDNKQINYHLIDIVPAGYKYNLFEYQKDFYTVISSLFSQQKSVIVCGGTGLYLEAIIKNYNLHEVPEDIDFRNSCLQRSKEDLMNELQSLKPLHNTSDFDTTKRLIRAIEIARFESKYGDTSIQHKVEYSPLVIGVDISREVRRERIETRLKSRLNEGFIAEVENLLQQGVSHETLQYYGLEYKFGSLYLLGEISKSDFEQQLCIAIQQFAKRQMTWFRGMQKRGIQIHWIQGEESMQNRVEQFLEIVKKFE